MGSDGDAVAHAKAVIDAPASGTGQYGDSNASVAALLGLAEAPHALWCSPEAMDGSTSRGFRNDVITGELKAWQFGPETTRLTFANTYPDAETATASRFEDYIAANDERFGPYQGLEVETEGRLVWTRGTVPTDEFDYLSPGGPDDGVHTPN